MKAWRIVKEHHTTDALSGTGANIYGGRWNSKGHKTVYASATLSLACLEQLVHVNRYSLLKTIRYRCIQLFFAPAFVSPLDRDKLPPDWRTEKAPPVCQALGDDWLTSMASLVLAVPSAVIEQEVNYLINPAHPDFQTIRQSPPQEFLFDQRLIR